MEYLCRGVPLPTGHGSVDPTTGAVLLYGQTTTSIVQSTPVVPRTLGLSPTERG